jgi:hypothetical protein
LQGFYKENKTGTKQRKNSIYFYSTHIFATKKDFFAVEN